MKTITIARLLKVSSTDPEDARRRRLLNIILLGVTSLTLLMLLGIFAISVSGILSRELITGPGLAVLMVFVSVVFSYLINRYWSGKIASILFLSTLIAVFAFIDDPRQVVEGRTLFLFAIPILMSSVILPPWASFAAAGVCGLVITIVAMLNLPDYAQGAPPIPTILGFFTVAFVSWLSARSLENALVDLRALNLDLEDRVRLRTHELQQANQELNETYDKLKELDRLKSRFVSMVSHELRTPLTAIQGFVEMMGDGIYGPITARHHEALDRILANDQRLLTLVNDLLDQARMEAGQLSLNSAPFSVKELVTDMESTMRVLAEVKGLYLTTHIEPNVPETLRGDAKRLHQILVNLINNAVKFAEQGGIDVRLYCPDGDHWAIDVVDTGPGIPEDAREYIFEPFRQVDSSVTRAYKGFGLGLAIVRQLAELMGGSARVTGELRKGSTFTVILPFEPPHPAGE